MQFCLSGPERKLDSSRNNVMRGKTLSPHNIRIDALPPPFWTLWWGGRLSGPGVCVILVVCQSGVGNGHRVITAALTASSISLYRCLSLSLPPSHSIFLTPGTEERKTDWVTEHHTRNAEWNRATTEWWCSGGWFLGLDQNIRLFKYSFGGLAFDFQFWDSNILFFFFLHLASPAKRFSTCPPSWTSATERSPMKDVRADL